jgi:hypothetical protein
VTKAAAEKKKEEEGEKMEAQGTGGRAKQLSSEA